jgi:hypothetical protein
MRVEFFRPDDEEKRTVAAATWDGRDVVVTSDDDDARAAVAHAFRRTPIAVDDAAHRPLGTQGPTVLQPGDLAWFRAAATTRATSESGLDARSVAETIDGGYDPAANYRPFEEQIERIDARGR